jgi:glycosyltransferase involved in cell wall biosynthesis/2-polyprenyl-3-methyl-5-hydroxy-6-metoxy-1,4-benzoquinol methylase
MSEVPRKRRVLVFIVAYNAERTIRDVIQRIPAALAEHETEILIIDDSSHDQTFEQASEVAKQAGLQFPVTVLFNPVNQGYGGNQKIGFHYAIRERFDAVALVHGDGQYAPERLPELLKPLLEGEADAVFGSRMLDRFSALRGGMPLYKYLGNKILTTFQNWLLRSSLSEFHSGYRLYSVAALERIPFERNTNDFHFDTEIIIQLFRAGLRIKELPIPTYYGDEICYVNGMKYALQVTKATLLARAQELGILYERKFDVSDPASDNPSSPYRAKLSFESPHTMALRRVPAGSTVLDIGCASGYVSRALSDKRCRVTGIDRFPAARDLPLERFIQHDLDQNDFPVDVARFQYVLLLDVIEHLHSPEVFIESLCKYRKASEDTTFIVSTGNIAFIITRLMLLLGFFNYGSRGILDITHTRLFTFATLESLFRQAGYQIDEVKGVPAPFALALGDGAIARFLLGLNKALIHLSKSLFSYQIFMVVRPLPSLEWLLERAAVKSKARAVGESVSSAL